MPAKYDLLANYNVLSCQLRQIAPPSPEPRQALEIDVWATSERQLRCATALAEESLDLLATTPDREMMYAMSNLWWTWSSMAEDEFGVDLYPALLLKHFNRYSRGAVELGGLFHSNAHIAVQVTVDQIVGGDVYPPKVRKLSQLKKISATRIKSNIEIESASALMHVSTPRSSRPDSNMLWGINKFEFQDAVSIPNRTKFSAQLKDWIRDGIVTERTRRTLDVDLGGFDPGTRQRIVDRLRLSGRLPASTEKSQTIALERLPMRANATA